VRERARVAVVALAGGRLVDVAGKGERRLVHERVHAGGARVRHEQHVGGLDALPAGDRRAVEGVAVRELVLVEHLHRHGDVLLLALGVGETQVHELDLVFLDHLEDIGRCHDSFS